MKNEQLRLLVGVGNPGMAFRWTRHNFGFLMADYFADSIGCIFKNKSSLRCSLAESSFEDVPIVIAKPTTYVNMVGDSVSLLSKHFSIPSERIMIMADNTEAHFGKISLSQRAGTGGHKGLRSVKQVFASSDYWSLKLGIGRPENGIDLSEFVLNAFSVGERAALTGIFKEAYLLVKKWILEEIT